MEEMEIRRGSEAQREKRAGIFLLGRSVWFQRARFMWSGKTDPLIISEHSGTAFFMLVDILIWEEIMKAIRSSPWLSHWAHNPFVTCLPSALKTSAFLFGFLSALRLCHHHYDKKACKLHVKGHISQNSACVCCC